MNEIYLKAKNLDAEAIQSLVVLILPTLGTGVHSRRGVEKIIRCHFGQTISHVSIRTDFRCTDAKLVIYRDLVLTVLNDLKKQSRRIKTDCDDAGLRSTQHGSKNTQNAPG